MKSGQAGSPLHYDVYAVRLETLVTIYRTAPTGVIAQIFPSPVTVSKTGI